MSVFNFHFGGEVVLFVFCVTAFAYPQFNFRIFYMNLHVLFVSIGVSVRFLSGVALVDGRMCRVFIGTCDIIHSTTAALALVVFCFFVFCHFFFH